MLVVAGHWELHMHIPEFGSQTVIPDNGFLYAAFKDSSGEFSCLVWGRTSLQHIWKALKKLLSVSLHQHFWAYWFPKGYRECSTGSLPAITLCSSTEKLVWAHFGQVAGLLHNLTIFWYLLWATVWMYLCFYKSRHSSLWPSWMPMTQGVEQQEIDCPSKRLLLILHWGPL